MMPRSYSGYSPPAGIEDENDHLENAMRKGLSLMAVREDSMELINDPRFVGSSIIDKRITALSSMVLVGTLMLGCSMSILFDMHKDILFDGSFKCTLCGIFQMGGFFMMVVVSLSCLASIFIMCQQFYHLYRLLTAGPEGMEVAGMYYLTPTVVLWRHHAVNTLLYALIWFIVAAGSILFVKFVKDGGSAARCFVHATVENTGAEQAKIHLAVSDADTALDYHFWFALVCWISYVIGAMVMIHIRAVHNKYFDKYYDMAGASRLTIPVTMNSQKAHNR